MNPTPEMIEAGVKAFLTSINNPLMVKCDRCDGKGYHHGFGEGGASPDWCEKCGGGQYDVAPGEEERAIEAAVTAALALLPGEPVAWQVRREGNMEWTTVQSTAGYSDRYEVRPLYAVPAPQPVAVKARWRVFEHIVHDWWGIEIDGDDDAEPILYPQKINRDYLDQIVAAHNAAIQPVTSQQVQVKALEWDGFSGVSAECTFGIYHISRIGNRWEMEFGRTQYDNYNVRATGVSTDFDQALIDGRAAAQADYESRIRSSLTVEAETGKEELFTREQMLAEVDRRVERALLAKRLVAEAKAEFDIETGKEETTTRLATVQDHNDAFDPADEVLGGAFKAGFREGWLFSRTADGEDYDECVDAYGGSVDMAPSECWDAYRSIYFAKLPLAAIPEVGAPIASPSPSVSEMEALRRENGAEAGEETIEAAAMAAFRQAQSVYRADHDHFPLRNTWQTTDERIRDGWRKVAAAALSAGKLNASKLNEKDIATAVAPYLEEDFTAWDVASAVLRLLLSQKGDGK